MPIQAPFVSPTGAQGLEVGIVGATNAGKSTFLNQVLGSDVSAVSNKQNTTNETIIGVVTNIERKT